MGLLGGRAVRTHEWNLADLLLLPGRWLRLRINAEEPCSGGFDVVVHLKL